MKGKAIIQIIKDGKIINQIEEKNTITNAANNLLTTHNFGFPFFIHSASSLKHNPLINYTPLNTNLFGGIMLFTNKKESSNLEEEIFPDVSDINGFIGNAGGTFSGQSEYRGTLNLTESGEITNGYRWTWDFGTDQTFLDGKTINRICLTSRAGGDAGLRKSDLDTTKTSVFSNYAKQNLINSINLGLSGSLNSTNYFIPYVRLDTDGIYLCNTKPDEFVTIQKVKDVANAYNFKRFKFKSNIGINDSINNENSLSKTSVELFDTVELIEHSQFTSINSFSVVAERYVFCNTDDLDNVFCTSISVDTSNSIIYYRKYNLSNSFSVIEDSSISIPSDLSSGLKNNYNIIEFEGSFYTINYSNKILYKINKDGTYSNYINIPVQMLNVFNGMLIGFTHNINVKLSNSNKQKIGFWNGAEFITNDFYLGGSGSDSQQYGNVNNFQTKTFNKRPVILTCSTNAYNATSMATYPSFNVFTPFFSSINNLDTGITKVEGSTLKIIYEITNS